MNEANQTILHIAPDSLPDADLVKAILDTKPTAFGFAVQEADEADMQVMREDGEALDLETINSFLEGRKARPTSMIFQGLKRPYDVEDIGPYTLTDGDGKTFMSLFSEGTLNGHDNPASHTEHYNFVTGLIIPKIVDFCEDFDGDIVKVLKKVNGDVFKNDVLGHLGHRGILHILPYAGDPVVIGKNIFDEASLGRKFNWGWCSLLPKGYGQKKEEPAPVAKKGWGYGSKAKASTETPKADPPKETPKETPKENPPGVHTVKDKPIEVGVRPPGWLHKNEHIKLFYEIIGHKGFANWKKRLPATIAQNHPNYSVLECKNLEDFTGWVLKNFKTGSAVMSNNSEQPKTKQERLAEQPEQGPVDPTALPIIEPKDLEKVLDYVAKHLDGNSKEIIDPKEMQKTETALPKFSEAVGVKLEEMLNWPVSGLFGMAATDPRAMVLFALEWRAYARQYLLAELKAKAKDGVKTTVDKVTTTKTDLGNGATKTESVVTQAPKKGWGYSRKAA